MPAPLPEPVPEAAPPQPKVLPPPVPAPAPAPAVQVAAPVAAPQPAAAARPEAVPGAEQRPDWRLTAEPEPAAYARAVFAALGGQLAVFVLVRNGQLAAVFLFYVIFWLWRCVHGLPGLFNHGGLILLFRHYGFQC